jgi:hypothetical protein
LEVFVKLDRWLPVLIVLCWSCIGAESEGDADAPPAPAAKKYKNFKQIVMSEEASGALTQAPPTIYTEKNAPVAPALEQLEKQDKITQHGITWTFDKPAPVGKFINGDWYVVGPVTITMIDPKPLFGEEVKETIHKIGIKENDFKGKWARHGSMLNPTIPKQTHASLKVNKVGFDSRLPEGRYNPELFAKLPIAMKPGDALISSISRANEEITSFSGQHVDAIKCQAVLSCVAAPQPADAFRPSYCDSANSKIHLARNLKRDLLLKLPRIEDMPRSLARHARQFQRPYIDIVEMGLAAPLENMPHYGQNIVEDFGEAALLLLSDYPAEEKERLLVNVVQVGIDLWGLTRAGRLWQAHGGLHSGRKGPLVLAGIFLGDEDMQSPTKKYPECHFAEDDQTAFFPYTYKGKTYEQAWTGAKVFFTGHSPWQNGGILGDWDRGWGPLELFHPKDWPIPGKPVLASEGYRRANTSPSWVAQALAFRLLHAEQIWNHDPFFAYVDRWMTEDDTAHIQVLKENGRQDMTKSKPGDFSRQGNVSNGPKWVKEMWLKHRNNLPPGPNGEKTPNAESTWTGEQPAPVRKS